MKSTQTLHLLFFFFTTIVFANHSEKNISLITPASFSLWTSKFTASTCSFDALLGLYFFGGNDGSTLSLWTMNLGSTLGTSYELQAKTSTFCKRNNNISTFSRSFMLVPIWKYLSVSGKILTFKASSATFALVSPRGFCNCYKVSLSVVSVCPTCLPFRLTATIRHCLAIRWFPRTMATPYLVGNLTFTCRVDGTAFIA